MAVRMLNRVACVALSVVIALAFMPAVAPARAQADDGSLAAGSAQLQENAVQTAQERSKAAGEKVKAAKAKWLAAYKLQGIKAKLKKRGSLGFFQYYASRGNAGARAAVKALKRKGYSKRDSDGRLFTSFTHYGRKGDATSLANFEKAVKWIPRGNKLRKNDNNFKGRKALRVSDVVMAMSESHANWSDSHINHAGKCGSNYPVGENLAWNYGSDPYYQWYTEEKAAYEGETEGQTGHYLNLMDDRYAATGFAVCSYGSMYGWNTYCQQFYFSSISGEKLYTVAQYKKRIAVYKKYLKSGSSAAKAAQKEYQDALAEKKQAAEALRAAS